MSLTDLPRQQLVILSAAVGGLASHQYFKRFEPSLQQVLVVVAGVASIAGGFPLLLPTLAGDLPPFDLTTIFLTVLSYLGSLGAAILYYRILSSSHPLHDIPGPLLAKATQAWLFSKVVNGQTRFDMMKVHKKYGDVVRIGPNEVSVATAEAFLQVHGAKSWIKGASYSQTASGMSSSTETSLISLRDHNAHTVRRKLWDKAFAMAALKDYQNLIVVRVEQLDEQLTTRAKKGETVDLHQWFGFFVWDVMSDLAYGGGGKMLSSATDTDAGLESLCSTLHLAGVNKVMPWISPAVNLLPISKTTVAFRTIATTLFKKRLEQGRLSAEKDVFFHLLGEGTDKKTELSTNELAADSALVIAAGADTTRLVLSTLFMLMARHPERYVELQKALDAGLSGDDTPTHDALAAIPLLDAYINEALRLNPPVPFANQREAPEGGQLIGPYHISEKTQVRFACYAIHHDPRYFSDPEKFLPERWLPEGENRGATVLDKRAFFPFLAGAYHCVGKQFALQEMRMVIATIVHKFDMKPSATFDSYEFEKAMEDRGLIEIHSPLALNLTLRRK